MQVAKMERRSRVIAATGALGPVRTKLTELLGDRLEFAHLKRWEKDIRFIRSELDSVYSLLLTIWEREDLRRDAACNDWMAEARRLSYSTEEAIARAGLTQPKTDATSLFEVLKEEVRSLLNQCSEDWKTTPGRTTTTSESEHHQPEANNVDPRSEFLHNDASELVEMDEKKYQLVRLLQEHHAVCIVGFAGMGKTTLADLVYQGIGKKFESRAFVSLSRRPNMTRVLTSLCTQVMASAVIYKRYATFHIQCHTSMSRLLVSVAVIPSNKFVYAEKQ